SKKIDITDGKPTDLGLINLMPITPTSSETKLIINFKDVDNKPRVGQYIVIYKQALDKEGKIVPGDTVAAEKTNNQGQIAINVEPGTYMIFTEGPGYGWTIKNVEIKKGETKTVDMILGRLMLDFGKDRAFENIKIGDEIAGEIFFRYIFFDVKLDSEGKLIYDLTPGRYDIIMPDKNDKYFNNVLIVEGKITKCDGINVFPPTPP
ncbi:MAG: carboxypeptidase-like regulatory domain-containing protein, partial [Minisyncoccia bacterium]